jgi:hypothetical protein
LTTPPGANRLLANFFREKKLSTSIAIHNVTSITATEADHDGSHWKWIVIETEKGTVRISCFPENGDVSKLEIKNG